MPIGQRAYPHLLIRRRNSQRPDTRNHFSIDDDFTARAIIAETFTVPLAGYARLRIGNVMQFSALLCHGLFFGLQQFEVCQHLLAVADRGDIRIGFADHALRIDDECITLRNYADENIAA